MWYNNDRMSSYAGLTPRIQKLLNWGITYHEMQRFKDASLETRACIQPDALIAGEY
jgi:hypothetical protein